MESFENKLEQLLSLKQANPEFVQKLKHRLLTEPRTTMEARRQYKALWIIAAALFSGGLALYLLSLNRGKSDSGQD